MSKLNEMIRRKKDQGFTLIELMIVIAVIGILAIVLVPKVGTIKTQAKGAGIDTNLRVVEGYIQSKIDKWVSMGTDNSVIQADIVAAFGTGKELTNPFTSLSPVAGTGIATASANQSLYVLSTIVDTDVTVDAAKTRGTIAVSVIGPELGPITSIKIYAHGNAGEALSEKTVTITP